MILLNKRRISYLSLIFVVFVWGVSPLLTLKLNEYFSPTFKVAVTDFILIIAYILLSGKNIKELNAKYFKVALLTGTFYALANILQKIGLQYTTPAKYAFLENLSCVTVPWLTFLFVGKRPKPITIIAGFVCLVSVFILNFSGLKGGVSFGKGEILCALAGLFYGVNIAGTGAFARELKAPLYLMIQALVSLVLSLILAFVLNNTYQSGSGVPVEKIVFSMNIYHIMFLVITVVVTSAMCWVIRTKAMKYVDAEKVAIIMPFSAVITGFASVCMGTDHFSINLVLGGFIGVLAIILSEMGERVNKRSESIISIE